MRSRCTIAPLLAAWGCASLLIAACGNSSAAPSDAGPPTNDGPVPQGVPDGAATRSDAMGETGPAMNASGVDAGSGLDASSGPDAGMPAPGASSDASGATSPDAGASPDAALEASSGHWIAYASGYAPTIQWLSVNAQTGALTPISSVGSFGTAPSFLAIDKTSQHLYAVDENTPGQVGAYDIDPASGAMSFLGAVSSGGDGPPFVTVDGPWVLVANYTSGSVAVLPVRSDGSLGASVDTKTVGAESHMILPDPSNRFVFVPCKSADFVAQFTFDASTGKLTPNAIPTMPTAVGAGPRHLAFHPNGTIAYLIDETASTMSELSLDTTLGTLTILQTVSTRPPGATGTNTGAEVHVHPSGRWLFGSNRGDDDLVVFALDASGAMSTPKFAKSGGMTPRDFALDATGSFLYAANEDTGNVVTFSFDASTGILTTTGASVTAPSASFIGLASLP